MERGDKITSIAGLKKAIEGHREFDALDLISEFEASVRAELKIVEGCPVTDDNKSALELNAKLLHRILGG